MDNLTRHLNNPNQPPHLSVRKPERDARSSNPSPGLPEKQPNTSAKQPAFLRTRQPDNLPPPATRHLNNPTNTAPSAQLPGNRHLDSPKNGASRHLDNPFCMLPRENWREGPWPVSQTSVTARFPAPAPDGRQWPSPRAGACSPPAARLQRPGWAEVCSSRPPAWHVPRAALPCDRT